MLSFVSFVLLVVISAGADSERRRLSPYENDPDRWWTRGYVPYVLGSGLHQDLGDRIRWAAQQLRENTNVRWGLRAVGSQTDYVVFVPSPEGDKTCYSPTGNRRSGAQNIHLNSKCQNFDVLHEMIHTLGFGHTHSRSDANKHIIVAQKYIGNSNLAEEDVDDFDDCLKYDPDSIMHYPGNYFEEGGKVTISTGFNDRLSTLDKRCISGLYSPCRIWLYERDGQTGAEFGPFGNQDRFWDWERSYGMDELNGLGWMNDAVTSVKIAADPYTKCVVEFYGDSDWDGWGSSIEVNNNMNMGWVDGTDGRNGHDVMKWQSFNLNALQTSGFQDNGLSSFKVIARPQCAVYMYNHDGYDGQMGGPYTIGRWDFEMLVQSGFGDQALSSISITNNAPFENSNSYCCVEMFYDAYLRGESTAVCQSGSKHSWKLDELENYYGFRNDAVRSFIVEFTIGGVDAIPNAEGEGLKIDEPTAVHGLNSEKTVFDVLEENGKNILIGLLVMTNIGIITGIYCCKKQNKYMKVSYVSDSEAVAMNQL